MDTLKTTLKRELLIGKTAYMLGVSPDRFKLVLKGKRYGLEMACHDLVSGDAAMAVALRASLDMPSPTARAKPRRRAAK